MERKNALKVDKIKCPRCDSDIGKNYLQDHQKRDKCKAIYYYRILQDPFFIRYYPENIESLTYDLDFVELNLEVKERDSVRINDYIFLPLHVAILSYLYFEKERDRRSLGNNNFLFKLQWDLYSNPLKHFRKNSKQKDTLENIFKNKEDMANFKKDAEYLYKLGGLDQVWVYINNLLEIK